jgi:hypothetical protein
MENSALNSLKTSKAQVENIIKYQDELRRNISQQGISNLRKCLGFMSAQLESVISGSQAKPAPTGEERAAAGEMARIFASVAIEKPIEPIFRDLTAAFLPIMHNWNAATVNDPDIATHIRLTDGVIKSQLTLMDTITVLQKTLERVRRTHTYEPPSFNLSRAYLDNLKKAIEEKGPDALVPPKPDASK